MSRPTHRLSNTELAMIQVMRKQPSYSDFDPNIDTAVRSEVTEAYRHDSPRYFAKLLAERAKLFCKERLGVGEKSIQEQFLHATGVAAVVLFVLSVIAFAAGLAIASSFFDVEKGSASVLAIFWLVALTALPIVFPVISLLFLVIHRSQHRQRTGMATVVIRSFRTIRRIWCKLALRLGLIEDADPNAVTSFEEVVASHSYFGSAGAVFIANLYFLVVALVIWGSVYFHLSTKRIDFFYQDSTSHIESRQTKIQHVASPVHWLTGTQIPSEDAIAWAGGTWVPPKPATAKSKNVTGSSTEDNPTETEAAESLAARLTQGFRVEWSRFLLALVFTYVFFPRLVVAVVSFGMTYYFRHDFVPKPTEKECRRIVDNILDPPIATETIHRNSDSESETQDLTNTVPDLVREKELPNAVPSNVETDASTTAQVGTVDSLRSTSRSTGIVAVGGNPDFSRIVSELALSDSRLADGGVLRSARDRGEFKKRLSENRCHRLVFVFSLLDVPAQNLVEFLDSVVDLCCDDSEADAERIDVVLSDGAKARERLENDLKLFQSRIEQWRTACVQCGVSSNRVHDVDLSTSSGIDTCRSLIAGPPAENSGEAVRRMAGKYMAAVSWLRIGFGRMFDEPSASGSWDEFAMTAMDKIDSIYQEERIELRRFFDSKACNDSLKQVVKNVELPPGVLPEQLEQFAKLGEFMKSLSPRWIGSGAIAGASLCLGGGVALALSAPTVAPLLAPFVAGSALASVVTGGGVGQWLKTRISTGEKSEDSDDVAGCLQINTSSVLQMLILRILILEFQGSSEQFITDQIGKQTEKLGELATANRSEVDGVLLAFKCNLDEVRRTIR